MLLAMQGFEAGELRLDRIAWALKSRIAVLRGIGNQEWADQLKDIWNELELVNAVVLAAGRTKLTEPEPLEVLDVLNSLRTALDASDPSAS